MTKKVGSKGLYEAMVADGLPTETFDRAQLRQMIWETEGRNAGPDYTPLEPMYPGENSFIDWAMKHEKITRVQAGLYRFVQDEPDDEEVVIKDTNPAHPVLEPGYKIAAMVVVLPKLGARIPRKMKKAMKKDVINDIIDEYGSHQVHDPRTIFSKVASGLYASETRFLVK